MVVFCCFFFAMVVSVTYISIVKQCKKASSIEYSAVSSNMKPSTEMPTQVLSEQHQPMIDFLTYAVCHSGTARGVQKIVGVSRQG